METNLLPIDIHKETPLELENFPKSIGLSNFAIQEIVNPLMLYVPKNFENVVVDVYVYHKYYRSHCINLEISTQRLVLKGKPLHQLEAQFKVSQG
jgi:hypothetical protein